MLSWVLPPRSLRLAAAPQRAPGARQHPGDLLGSPCAPRTGAHAPLPDLEGSAGGSGGGGWVTGRAMNSARGKKRPYWYSGQRRLRSSLVPGRLITISGASPQ